MITLLRFETCYHSVPKRAAAVVSRRGVGVADCNSGTVYCNRGAGMRVNYTIHYILSSSRRNWMDYAQKDEAKDRKTMLSTLSTTRLDF
ncbi:unnamed protein product [Caenorhabditis auriculariae]|uniref:Uncharacterized protein n=1 Tax=Caenorhabditis auriculariae TaxID=2777116 RepID=A0A8S1HR22_9PELO|nr:unnamed protein product [Caenorhabditis auriculariae]